MSTTTNYPESPEGSSPTNCPHCGAKEDRIMPNLFECGSWIEPSTEVFNRSAQCVAIVECRNVRAARQKAEAEVADARANADSWRVQSERFERQLLETSNQLAETRKELEVVKGCFLTAKTALESASQKLSETRRKLEEAHQAVRYLFYARNAIGETASDVMMEKEPERWRAFYEMLNPEAEKGGAS